MSRSFLLTLRAPLLTIAGNKLSSQTDGSLEASTAARWLFTTSSLLWDAVVTLVLPVPGTLRLVCIMASIKLSSTNVLRETT